MIYILKHLSIDLKEIVNSANIYDFCYVPDSVLGGRDEDMKSYNTFARRT